MLKKKKKIYIFVEIVNDNSMRWVLLLYYTVQNIKKTVNYFKQRLESVESWVFVFGKLYLKLQLDSCLKALNTCQRFLTWCIPPNAYNLKTCESFGLNW